MVVTLDGMITLSKLVQPKKANDPIVLIPYGRVIFARLVQPLKVLGSIDVTFGGTVNDVRLTHS